MRRAQQRADASCEIIDMAGDGGGVAAGKRDDFDIWGSIAPAARGVVRGSGAILWLEEHDASGICGREIAPGDCGVRGE